MLSQIAKLVDQFEQGLLTPDDLVKQLNVTVAEWYLNR